MNSRQPDWWVLQFFRFIEQTKHCAQIYVKTTEWLETASLIAVCRIYNVFQVETGRYSTGRKRIFTHKYINEDLGETFKKRLFGSSTISDFSTVFVIDICILQSLEEMKMLNTSFVCDLIMVILRTEKRLALYDIYKKKGINKRKKNGIVGILTLEWRHSWLWRELSFFGIFTINYSRRRVYYPRSKVGVICGE